MHPYIALCLITREAHRANARPHAGGERKKLRRTLAAWLQQVTMNQE